MLLDPDTITSILGLLGLTTGLFKPIPDLVNGLLAPLDSAVNGVVNTADGILTPLGVPALTSLPIVGGLLQADPTTSVSMPSATAASGSFVVGNTQSLENSNTSCAVEPYEAPNLQQGFPAYDEAEANIYRYRQQQSVNLGSWFVHEQWMTPSVFACAASPQMAEIDIAMGWGSPSGAQAVLERHWDTFITQSDFEYLASIGINTVRLPIGYWSLGPQYCQGTPFEPVSAVYTNAWSRVVNAINMAGQAGIGVLVDLHGAPGSQNGQYHSGISDGQTNLFNSTSDQQKTFDVLTFLAQQLASVTNVIGIEILNEPIDAPQLGDFYTQAITNIRQLSPEASTLPLYVQDAFDLQRFSDFVAARTDFVVEDHHSYFVFNSPEDTNPATQDTSEVQTSISDQLSSASNAQRGNLIVGEWSCALSPQSLANISDQMLVRQQFCEGQEQTYANNTAGWGFWSYNLEDCATDLDWCFKNIVGNTLPSTFFSYSRAPLMTPDELAALTLAIANVTVPSTSQVLGYAYEQSDFQPSSSTQLVTSTMSSATNPSPVAVQRRDSHAAHRFSAIHMRHYTDNLVSLQQRDNSTMSMSLTPTEIAITRGYSDGFLSAKIFAQYNMSKLGFVGQYIADSITALGPSVIESGQEPYYTQWFNRGLNDAENLINVANNS